MKDVAQAAGTSTAAVSATLSGSTNNNVRVSETTKKRILEAVEDLGYVPKFAPRKSPSSKTGVIGLSFPYREAFIDRNPFCTQVMTGVFKEAIDSSLNTMLYTVQEGFWTARHKIDPRIDGLIAVLAEPDDLIVKRCREAGFPCVGLVCPRIEGIMTVNAADEEGGRIATQHLINLGHKRIAMLMGQPRVSTSEPRLRGFKAAMEQSGLPVFDELLVQAGHDWKPGYAAMNQILDRPKSTWPTAVFAVNDMCAAGAMKAMRERKITIGGDIVIVGFDDTWFAATLRPGLTSVRMPIQTMGAVAVRLLVEKLNGQEPVDPDPVLDVFLTIRHSCGSDSPEPKQDDIDEYT